MTGRDDGPVVARQFRLPKAHDGEIIESRANRWFARPPEDPSLWRHFRFLGQMSAKLSRKLTHFAWWHVRIDPSGYVRPTGLVFGGVATIIITLVILITVVSSVMLPENPIALPIKQKDKAHASLSAQEKKAATRGSRDRRSSAATDAVPAAMLSLYRDAARTCDMPWEVLAAVGWIETKHGSLDAPGVKSGSNFAGAQGPMQFLPATWAAYGVDANNDGRADVYNPRDAIHGAAKYLCANGAADPNKVKSALWHYNHSDEYVNQVLKMAAEYRRSVYVLPLPVDAVSRQVLSRPHHDYSAIDVPIAVGTPIYAARAGKVHLIKNGDCGWGMRIDGTDGNRYTYCHASALIATNGKNVEAGDLIMRSGGAAGTAGAGNSSGPHLHLDIEVKGQNVCPQRLLQAWAEGKFANPADANRSGCSY